jgi:hypothetical protein
LIDAFSFMTYLLGITVGSVYVILWKESIKSWYDYFKRNW